MRIFSGIRPTGDIHLGNYFGAIKQWIALQNEHDCVFCAVDLHAITTPYDPKKMQAQIFDLATSYLAAGLDPEKCVLFVQSHVKEHSELAWRDLMTRFEVIDTPSRLGDIIAYRRSGSHSVDHACSFVAAGIVFTKNGFTFSAPWCLSRLVDVDALFLKPEGMEKICFRARGMGGLP